VALRQDSTEFFSSPANSHSTKFYKLIFHPGLIQCPNHTNSHSNSYGRMRLRPLGMPVQFSSNVTSLICCFVRQVDREANQENMAQSNRIEYIQTGLIKCNEI
jgi:hypothetical protein